MAEKSFWDTDIFDCLGDLWGFGEVENGGKTEGQQSNRRETSTSDGEAGRDSGKRTVVYGDIFVSPRRKRRASANAEPEKVDSAKDEAEDGDD